MPEEESKYRQYTDPRLVLPAGAGRLEAELVKLSLWIRETGTRAGVLFEGRDAAGKGGVIKRITNRTNPRIVRLVALGGPTEDEASQWYFQRLRRPPSEGG